LRKSFLNLILDKKFFCFKIKILLKFNLFVRMVFVNIFFGLVIKFASIAPEGSYWYDVAMKIKKNLEYDDVKVIVYAGAAMGDEADIVRKIRIGQLHAAGLTSHGLEMISPEVRAYDIPGVFKSYEEFFEVRDRLFPELSRRYYEKGYVLLSHFAIGFVYIWVWIGDVLAKYQATELVGLFKVVPLQITDVLQALATGMVDTVFNTFYALHALQWNKFVKSYIPVPQFIYSAGIVMRKDIWEKIPEEKRNSAQKLIWEYGIKTERDIIKIEENVRGEFLKKIKAENNPEKIKELEKINEKIKQKILQDNKEIRDFYSLIEKELARIRREKK
jgi:TRAP-type C4-dicarboxylate transport system substrate-binding protein